MKTQALEMTKNYLYGGFWQGIADTPNKLASIAYEVPSSEAVNEYRWLGQAGKMREWKGERQHRKVAEFTFSISNKLYEVTYPIDYFTWSSDNARPSVELLARQAAEKAQWFPWTIFCDLLEDNPTCYDGKDFFASDHTYGTGSEYTTAQDNDLSYNAASTTALTGFEAMEIFEDLSDHFLSVKDAAGDPIFGDVDRGRIVVVCHPDYRQGFLRALKNDVLYDTSNNAHENLAKGEFDLISTSHLTSASSSAYVYAFLTGVSRFPIIYQTHTPVTPRDNASEVLGVTGTSDFIFGVSAAFSVGVGDWATAVRVNIT